MIAIDTNILIYAHRKESPWFKPAYEAISSVAENGTNWAIPWPSVHEFVSIVTHPRIFDVPSTREQAFAQVDAWLEAPTLSLLSETSDHWLRLKETMTDGKISGPTTHDAKIAAICVSIGVTEFWTADRSAGADSWTVFETDGGRSAPHNVLSGPSGMRFGLR